MGSVGIIVGIFLIFSFSVSWISGDKEQDRLSDTIKETTTEKKNLEMDMRIAKAKAAEDAETMKKLRGEIDKELREKKRLERTLAFEKRQRRIAMEQGQVTDLEAEREKIREEIEAKVKQEISELEAKLIAVEEAKKRIESDMRLKIEEEARKKAEAAWTQAELARAKAEEAAEKSMELQARLDELSETQKEVEEALKAQKLARIEAEQDRKSPPGPPSRRG